MLSTATAERLLNENVISQLDFLASYNKAGLKNRIADILMYLFEMNDYRPPDDFKDHIALLKVFYDLIDVLPDAEA